MCQACADAGCLEVCVGWLRGSVLGERVVRLASELCALGLKGSPSASPTLDQDNHSWRLISLALSQQHDDGKCTQTKMYTELSLCLYVTNVLLYISLSGTSFAC